MTDFSLYLSLEGSVPQGPKQPFPPHVIARECSPATEAIFYPIEWVMNQYFIYSMTNFSNTALYIGVTNDLIRRVHEHKTDVTGGFTQKYRLHKLVYYEMTESITAAITREKQLKGGSRKKKMDLINSMNPEWKDLYDSL